MHKKDLAVPPAELPPTFPHKEFPLHSYIQEISTLSKRKSYNFQGLLIITTRTATEMVKISTVHYKNVQKGQILWKTQRFVLLFQNEDSLTMMVIP